MYVTGRGFRDFAGNGQTWGRQRKRPTDRQWTTSKKPCVLFLATGLVSLETRASSYQLECDCVQLAKMEDTDMNCVKEILWDVNGVLLCPNL